MTAADVCAGGPDAGFGHTEAQRDAEVARLVRENEALAGRNAALMAENVALREQVADLREQVSVLSRLVFGRSSEKKRQAPALDAEPDVADGSGEGEAGQPQRRKRGQQPGSAGHGRRDYSHLETHEVVHDLDEADRTCKRCGTAYAPFGEERCEQIDWRVTVVRVVHRRRSYRRACRCAVPALVCPPPPPKPIGKGRFTSQFLARLLVGKYVLGQPVHRIVAGLAHDGFDVAEGTLTGALRAVSPLLAPLFQAICDRNVGAGHLHVDETSWKVFAAVPGKDGHRWWLWVFVAPDTTVFRLAPTRSTKVLAEHLGIDVAAGALEPGRQLLISSDFFTVYQCLATVDGVDPLWCWAHVRRHFVRAGDAHKKTLAGWASDWVGRIGALYIAHRALAAIDLADPQADTVAGQAQAAFDTALATIDQVRRQQAADPDLPAPARKVLDTLDREWDGLVRHQQHPRLPLDNNTAERALRTPVVGRKNYHGSGSQWAADLAGYAWSITATASRAGLNPQTYLTAYLNACAANGAKPLHGQQLARFLPWTADPADLQAWQQATPARGP